MEKIMSILFILSKIAELLRDLNVCPEAKGKRSREKFNMLLFWIYRWGYQAGLSQKWPITDYGKDRYGKEGGGVWLCERKPQRPVMPARCPPGGGPDEWQKRQKCNTDTNTFRLQNNVRRIDWWRWIDNSHDERLELCLPWAFILYLCRWLTKPLWSLWCLVITVVLLVMSNPFSFCQL